MSSILYRKAKTWTPVDELNGSRESMVLRITNNRAVKRPPTVSFLTIRKNISKGSNMKTIHQILLDAVNILKQNNVQTPRLDAEVILAHLLGWDRIDLITRSREVLDQDLEQEYYHFIQERAAGKPVQYITGQQEFMGLNFKVTPDVLIPRPDTEILVETAIKEAGTMEPPLTIVDVGTGSGAISISLAHYIKGAHIHSIDISPKALGVAMENARLHSLEHRVTFYQGDLFDPIDDLLRSRVDLWVSTLPIFQPTKFQTFKGRYDAMSHIALDGGGWAGLLSANHQEGEKFLSPGVV